MNKEQLVSAIASKTQLTPKDANAALTAAMEAIVEAVSAGDKVSLIGFGSFEKRDRKERMTRIPKTQELIQIPACKVARFSPGKIFRDAVNN